MSPKYDKTDCPLCNRYDGYSFFEDKKRIYLRCYNCKLVFVPKGYWLSCNDERAIYDLHENDEQDKRYRQFLSRLATPLAARLKTKQKGLDFGCGSGPALSFILEEEGHQMDLYDPYYYNDPCVFDNQYDFICATEVVEHMHNPSNDFTALFSMLKRGGFLGIMTKMLIDENHFLKWHYIRDMTHICFYDRRTFEYIARRFNAELRFITNDVILFNKR